jgi:DhnA family fructose-bisphosphate aldolase class Ia
VRSIAPATATVFQGRNTFQRPKPEALVMLSRIIKINQGKD